MEAPKAMTPLAGDEGAPFLNVEGSQPAQSARRWLRPVGVSVAAALAVAIVVFVAPGSVQKRPSANDDILGLAAQRLQDSVVLLNGCCQEMSAECHACKAGVTVEAYCDVHKDAVGCPSSLARNAAFEPIALFEKVAASEKICTDGFLFHFSVDVKVGSKAKHETVKLMHDASGSMNLTMDVKRYGPGKVKLSLKKMDGKMITVETGLKCQQHTWQTIKIKKSRDGAVCLSVTSSLKETKHPPTPTCAYLAMDAAPEMAQIDHMDSLVLGGGGGVEVKNFKQTAGAIPLSFHGAYPKDVTAAQNAASAAIAIAASKFLDTSYCPTAVSGDKKKGVIYHSTLFWEGGHCKEAKMSPCDVQEKLKKADLKWVLVSKMGDKTIDKIVLPSGVEACEDWTCIASDPVISAKGLNFIGATGQAKCCEPKAAPGKLDLGGNAPDTAKVTGEPYLKLDYVPATMGSEVVSAQTGKLYPDCQDICNAYPGCKAFTYYDDGSTTECKFYGKCLKKCVKPMISPVSTVTYYRNCSVPDANDGNYACMFSGIKSEDYKEDKFLKELKEQFKALNMTDKAISGLKFTVNNMNEFTDKLTQMLPKQLKEKKDFVVELPVTPVTVAISGTQDSFEQFTDKVAGEPVTVMGSACTFRYTHGMNREIFDQIPGMAKKMKADELPKFAAEVDLKSLGAPPQVELEDPMRKLIQPPVPDRDLKRGPPKPFFLKGGPPKPTVKGGPPKPTDFPFATDGFSFSFHLTVDITDFSTFELAKSKDEVLQLTTVEGTTYPWKHKGKKLVTGKLRFTAKILNQNGFAGCDVESVEFCSSQKHIVEITKTKDSCCITVTPAGEMEQHIAEWYTENVNFEGADLVAKRCSKKEAHCNSFQAEPIEEITLFPSAGVMWSDYEQTQGAVTSSFSIKMGFPDDSDDQARLVQAIQEAYALQAGGDVLASLVSVSLKNDASLFPNPLKLGGGGTISVQVTVYTEKDAVGVMQRLQDQSDDLKATLSIRINQAGFSIKENDIKNLKTPADEWTCGSIGGETCAAYQVPTWAKLSKCYGGACSTVCCKPVTCLNVKCDDPLRKNPLGLMRKCYNADDCLDKCCLMPCKDYHCSCRGSCPCPLAFAKVAKPSKAGKTCCKERLSPCCKGPIAACVACMRCQSTEAYCMKQLLKLGLPGHHRRLAGSSSNFLEASPKEAGPVVPAKPMRAPSAAEVRRSSPRRLGMGDAMDKAGGFAKKMKKAQKIYDMMFPNKDAVSVNDDSLDVNSKEKAAAWKEGWEAVVLEGKAKQCHNIVTGCEVKFGAQCPWKLMYVFLLNRGCGFRPKPARTVSVLTDTIHAVSCGDDKLCYIWKIRGAVPREVFPQHTGPVYAATPLHDASWIISAGEDDRGQGQAFVWYWRRGTLFKAFSSDRRNPEGGYDGNYEKAPYFSVAEMPAWRLVALGASGGDVEVWNWMTENNINLPWGSAKWQSIVRFYETEVHAAWPTVAATGYEQEIWEECFSKQFEFWQTSVKNSAAYKWWEATYNFFHANRMGAVYGVSYVPTRIRLVSAHADGRVRYWDAVSGQLLMVMRGHQGPVRAVMGAPQAQFAVSGGDDGTARVWCLRTGVQLMLLWQPWGGAILSLVILPGGTQVAVGSSDGFVRIWDIKTGLMHCEFNTWGGPVNSITTNPSNPLGQLITANEDGFVRVFNPDGVQ